MTTARMTGTAWNRGLINALICSLGIIVVLGLATAVSMFVFQQTFSFSLLISYVGLMVAILLAFTGGWFYGRTHRGPVLLDCGAHPTRWLFFLKAAFFLFLGWNSGSETFTENFNIYRTGVGVFFAAFSLYWLVMASGRLQICENGLWLYWGLMPWHKIGHYEWKNDTLLLRSKARFALLRKGAVPVSSVDQPSVEELLQKNVSLTSEKVVEEPV
jgi:hypothetical protein